MANTRTTIAADTAAVKLCTVRRPQSVGQLWGALIHAYGTFGGGTLSYLLSTDGGTHKTTIKDGSGVNYSTTAADGFPISGIGAASNNGAEAIIYAALTGSTSPSIAIDVLDNT